MAKSPEASKQLGLTRGKAILIGVLAAALVGVLYIQYGGSSGDEAFGVIETTATSLAPAPRPAQRSVAGATTTPAESGGTQAAMLEFDQNKWKSPELSVVLAYDPFALPSGFPQPPRTAVDPRVASGEIDAETAAQSAKDMADALEDLRMQLEDLKQRGVHVIVSQNDEYVAVIGDRTIHVGDQINEFTVTEIDPQGVRVEWKGSE